MTPDKPPLPNYQAFKKAIILTVTLLTLFMVALFAWKAYGEYHLTVQSAEAKGKAYARALKEHAERAFGEADTTLLNILENARSHANLQKESPARLKEQLATLMKNAPQVASIVLISPEGILYANSYDSFTHPLDVTDRDFVIHHCENPNDFKPYISQPFKSRITDKWRFTISRSIYDQRGRFLGIVAAAMEIDYFRQLYGSLDLGKNGKIVMIRRDGKFLMAEPSTDRDYSVDFSKSHIIQLHLPRSPKGIFHISGDKTLIGSDDRVIAYESLDNFPIVAMANQSLDEVTSLWKERTGKQGGILALAVSTLCLLTFTLTRQIKKIEKGYARELEQRQEIAAAATAWRTTFDSVEDAIWVMDMNRRITRCNKSTTRIFGKGMDQILDRLCCEIAHNGKNPLPTCPFNTMISTRQRAWMELQIESRWFKVSVDPVFSEKGDITGAVHIVSDITSMKEAVAERELLEQKLGQSQKMEAIGHLAGGIAHDFNNLLTPIMGYAEMAASDISPNDPISSKLAGILSAAHKAKGLTQQLLSFSRRKSADTEILDLNEVILSLNDILRRTIKESIRIELGLTPDAPCINGDRTQLEQILINLTVNAQDAMGGDPGKIRIETCEVAMEGENARLYPGMIPGSYVLLSFSDSGSGMPQEVLDHIFEPFFTTKTSGHGTGLGLATVYGIVKQHNAFIGVNSRVGEGTTFTLYFPQVARSCEQPANQQIAVTGKRIGEGEVMLVEDNEMVRTMVHQMLLKMGYRVTVFSNPLEALGQAKESSRSTDLLVSDIVMPDMSGPELYEQLLLLMPDMKVIFISGYPINPSLRGGKLEDEITYLQKPFTAEALMERIRQIL